MGYVSSQERVDPFKHVPSLKPTWPLKIGFPKRKVVFHPFFSGKLSNFREGTHFNPCFGPIRFFFSGKTQTFDVFFSAQFRDEALPLATPPASCPTWTLERHRNGDKVLLSIVYTNPKFNIAPEKWWLEDCLLFRGYVKLWEGTGCLILGKLLFSSPNLQLLPINSGIFCPKNYALETCGTSRNVICFAGLDDWCLFLKPPKLFSSKTP